MRVFRSGGLAAGLVITLAASLTFAVEGSVLIFAVITEVPQDRTHVPADVFWSGEVERSTLIADEGVLQNIMWKKLEVCQSLKAQAQKVSAGYRIISFRILGAGMLPMPLQGIAGDCLLKKALDYAPLLD